MLIAFVSICADGGPSRRQAGLTHGRVSWRFRYFSATHASERAKEVSHRSLLTLLSNSSSWILNLSVPYRVQRWRRILMVTSYCMLSAHYGSEQPVSGTSKITLSQELGTE